MLSFCCCWKCSVWLSKSLWWKWLSCFVFVWMKLWRCLVIVVIWFVMWMLVVVVMCSCICVWWWWLWCWWIVWRWVCWLWLKVVRLLCWLLLMVLCRWSNVCCVVVGNENVGLRVGVFYVFLCSWCMCWLCVYWYCVM